METARLTFLAFSLFFAMTFAAAARLFLGRSGSPILWAYVIVTVFFVYLLPVQEYSLSVGAEVLLLAHLLLLGFLISVLVTARKHCVTLGKLVTSVRAVPDSAIFAVFGVWLAWRSYLIFNYGPAALMFSRAELLVSKGLVEFSSLEVALSSITTLALLGCVTVIVVRMAINESSRHLLLTAAAMIMLLLIVVTGESPIGSRRLVMVLGALWLSVAWVRSGMSALNWMRSHFKGIILSVVIVATLTVYYQNIRNNDLSEVLNAREPAELIAATAEFATSYRSGQASNEVQYLRSGPLDFFAKVVDVSIVGGRKSKGAATLFSLALVIPKALYPGQKPVGDVDDILVEELSIYPSKPFISVDYPTSLPAIGCADFGVTGIMLFAFILSRCFGAIRLALLHFQLYPHALLVSLGVALVLIGSQEAGLTALLSSIRDGGVAIFCLIVGHRLSLGAYQMLKMGFCGEVKEKDLDPVV